MVAGWKVTATPTDKLQIARMIRARLHKLGIEKGFSAVFSAEPVRKEAVVLCEEQNKRSNIGTLSYTPAMFGIACASVVIRDLIGEFEYKK